MYEIKNVAQDIKAAAKRRRAILIVTPILFLIAASIALYYIEPEYKSSTTIMVEKDETLNPLVLYDMAVSLASEDRLKSMNEIVYSRSTMEVLIDSLNLDDKVRIKADKQRLIADLQKSIVTHSRGSDSFEISYYDNDPVRARDGAELISNYFIKRKIELETRRHEETVAFFQKKLNELESTVSSQRNQAESVTTERLENLPNDPEVLQDRLQSIEGQIENIQWRIIQQEENLDHIQAFQKQSNTREGLKELYKLPLSDIQFGAELLTLLNEYDDLQQQYTENYPGLRSLSEKIKQVASRIPATIESDLKRLKNHKNDLTRQKSQVVNNMQQYYMVNQRAQSQQSDHSIYEGLYNEMKVKLEQAKMTRDIGKNAADQFIVLDEAVVPEKPASPNKRLILGIGLLLGLIVGVAASALAEVMDTTLRDDEDIPYNKPIIAYISNE